MGSQGARLQRPRCASRIAGRRRRDHGHYLNGNKTRRQWLYLLAMLLTTMSSTAAFEYNDNKSRTTEQRARRLRRGLQAFSVNLGRPKSNTNDEKGKGSGSFPSDSSGGSDSGSGGGYEGTGSVYRASGFFGATVEPSSSHTSSNTTSGTDSAKWHPDKGSGSFSIGSFEAAATSSVSPPSSSSSMQSQQQQSTTASPSPQDPVGSSTSREVPPPEQDTPSAAFATSNSIPTDHEDMDNNGMGSSSSNGNNDTKLDGDNQEATPAPSPEEQLIINNTVQVSLSLALPLTWNLSSAQHSEAVELLVEEVSNAATRLFHSTLDNAITMLEASPNQIETASKNHDDEQDDKQHRAPDSNHEAFNNTSNSSSHGAFNGTLLVEDREEDVDGDYYTDDSLLNNDHSNRSASDSTVVINMTWADLVDGNATDHNSNGTKLDDDVFGLVDDYYYYDQPQQDQEDQEDEEMVETTATPAPSSETMLWDWLEMAPLSKEDLYHMVLEYLEITEDDDEQAPDESSNATATEQNGGDQGSPLLQDLKQEIRNAIYSFFFDGEDFEGEGEESNNNGNATNTNQTDANAWYHHNGNGTDYPNNNHLNQTGYSNDTNIDHIMMAAFDDDMIIDDMTDRGDKGGEQPLNFAPSGRWEMFLANTRIELVQEAGTYAWWKLTMIYPVYVHYQAVLDDYEHYSGDMNIGNSDGGGIHRRRRRGLRGVWGDADTVAFNMGSGPPANGSIASADATPPPTADNIVDSRTPYWVPVQDKGTLDFISRLLQRVLQAAVVSGAFLSSMIELADMEHNDAEDLVNQILDLAMPGAEHVLEELFDEFVADDILPPEVPVMPEVEPIEQEPEPIVVETERKFTHGLLDDPDSTSRERMGVGMFVITLCSVSGIVFLAQQRKRTAETLAMERQQAWLLGTEQDVAELLQVGWRHKEIPVQTTRRQNSGDLEAPSSPVHKAEVFEVFDKGGAGYYEDDSMLHGSAMQFSFGGTESSNAGFRHVPVPPKGWLRSASVECGAGWKDVTLD